MSNIYVKIRLTVEPDRATFYAESGSRQVSCEPFWQDKERDEVDMQTSTVDDCGYWSATSATNSQKERSNIGIS